MAEMCLMASHGYPPGLGVVFNPEQGFNRASKDMHHLLHFSSNQDFVNSLSCNLSLQPKEERKSTGSLLDCNPRVMIDANSRRPALIDVQGNHLNSLLFCFGIAEQCTRQEILKLIASGSIEVKDGLLDLSMLYDLLGPHQLPQQLFASGMCCNDAKSQQSLVYPAREFYFNEAVLDLNGERSSCPENIFHPNGQLRYNFAATDMNDVLSFISDLYLSKNTTKSSKLTMLVPYFERRRRARSNAASPKLATEKAKEKTSKKKKASTRTPKERDINCNSYLHACENLLSLIVNRKQQDQNTIASLKKSSPQLLQLLIQFSATIAGTGVAVVLSTLCRIGCGKVPLSASKILNTGLGLGIIWLSWGVNKLRETVSFLSKRSGKMGAREDEMMEHLDRNLKDIFFRAAALMVVVMLRFA
ncbi:hypothetical protein CDL12_29252 [Handroanthus impetiginosus]|uniref:Uncharacterized protein n=1 Tax=Handroanthus impetiginosus TaxID=429701 RepID=A0A2G9FYX2_9LAMI|nr:hypothetical protein CDL12_29252 [Handroanthus impetiginosus]